MKCPVCHMDLSPLDIVSRNEHIELCLENGPSLVEYEGGQLVVKRNIPLDKQRKICPICSKTFQNIFAHFKSCALKNDLTPDLMQVHWFQLNDECKTNKGFPRDLLESYIAKSTREGRVGEQVEFARDLLRTIPENPKAKKASRAANQTNPSNHPVADESDQSVINSNADSNSVPYLDGATTDHGDQQQQLPNAPSAHQILMRPAQVVTSSRQASKAKTRLESTSKVDKKANIELRMERELAAPRLRRYRQALDAAGVTQAQEGGSDECVILSQREAGEELQTQLAAAAAAARDGQDEILDLSKYFYRARLKDCTRRDACERAECKGHDVYLGLDEFWVYYGKSLLEPTRHGPVEPPSEEETPAYSSLVPQPVVSNDNNRDLPHSDTDTVNSSQGVQHHPEKSAQTTLKTAGQSSEANELTDTTGAVEVIKPRHEPCDIVQLKMDEGTEPLATVALDGN